MCALMPLGPTKEACGQGPDQPGYHRIRRHRPGQARLLGST